MENLRLPKPERVKFIESEKYKRKVEQSKYKMRDKPFTERFEKLQILAIIGTFFFPVISVLTAIAFLYAWIYGGTGYFFLSITVSFLILVMIELTKNHLINNGLDIYFSNSGKSTVVFMFASLFSIASFVMSYNGAEMLVKNMDKSKQKINVNTNDEINTINLKFNGLISSEKKKIAFLQKKAKKQWNGLLTPGQSARVLQYEKTIEQYRAQNEKYKDRTLNKEIAETSKAESKIIYNAYVFKIIAAINEFLTIISIAFLTFYHFKTVQEDVYLTEFKEAPRSKYNEFGVKQNLDAITEPDSLEAQQQLRLNDISLNSSPTRTVVKGFSNDSAVKRSPLNDDRLTMTVATEKKRTCKQCGNEFEHKHWNKQYCSDTCRIAHWEKETGAKVRKLKKA